METTVTREQVEARYCRGKDAVRAGEWEKATAELLWCYDEGMVQVGSFAGVRGSFLLSELRTVARVHAPALRALQERRDRAWVKFTATTVDAGAARDWANLNHALDDDEKTIGFWEKLATDDPRQAGLATIFVYQKLVEAGRYADAVRARPFPAMMASLELALHPPDCAVDEAICEDLLQHAIRYGARDAAALAAGGRIDDARLLATRLMQARHDATTRELLTAAFRRIGRGDDLPAIGLRDEN